MERSRPIAEASSSREAAAYDYCSSFSSYNGQVPFETQPINRDGNGGYHADRLSKRYDKEALGPAGDSISRDYSYTSSYDDLRRRYGYGSDGGSHLSEAYKGSIYDGPSAYQSSYLSSASPRTSGISQDVGSTFGSRHHVFADEHTTFKRYDDGLGSQKSILESKGKPDDMAYESSTVGVRGAFDYEPRYSVKDYNVHSEQSTSGYYALTETSMTGLMRDDKSSYLLASKYEPPPSGFHLPSSGASYDWKSADGFQRAPAELGWKDFNSLSSIRHEQGTFERAESSSRFMDDSAFPELRGYGKLSVWNETSGRQAELDLGQKGHTNADANGSKMADTKEVVQDVGLPKPAIEAKKRQSRWEPVEESKKNREDGIEKPKKKSRWAAEKSPVKETAAPNIMKEHPIESADVIALKVRLVIINKMLQSGKVLDDCNTERSPSPEPVFDNFGFRINTREYRAREKLNKERQKIAARLLETSVPLNLSGGKPSKLSKKIYIPASKYPDYNFIGLIIGPRGHTQKKMEKESGARIFIRGKGSAKEGVASTNALSSDSDNLHVLIEADSEDALKKASDMVEKILVPVQDGENELKKAQLRELASMNGTLRVYEVCNQCKEPGHVAKNCGSNLLKGGPVEDNADTAVADVRIDNESDNTHLYVACLPSSVNDDQLLSLFSPFGQVLLAEVMKDPSTGLSKCSGFVKFADAVDAAQAAALMNGYQVDGKVLEVKFKTKSNLAS
ncbi:hypothetical protein L7F22_040309 [Adiantum nelumboides]|nr:hypothetical protein [Adiantum nelumboides]